MLEYVRTQANKTLQPALVRKFHKIPPTALKYHQYFWEEGCLGRVKRSGRPPESEETVEKVRKVLFDFHIIHKLILLCRVVASVLPDY